ncbi:MAG: hypothetical protein L6R42_006171 [Xanthoria sp. 1 TBL-2021]|nr:MAG: hypothetical protein L6R42_006171 [Xanthoria sp. 1 TBL-2021]
MSTLRSTPSTTDSHTPNHVHAFNDYTYSDPFFAAPVDDEQLVEFSAHTSPDSNLYSNVSSPPAKSHRDTSLAPESQSQAQHQTHQSLAHSLRPSGNSPHNASNGCTTHNQLSPGLPSDNGHDQSDRSGTPEHHDDLALGADFTDFLNDYGDDVDLNHWSGASDTHSPEPIHIDTYTPSGRRSTTNPPSAGTATLVSRLMSPVLTDNASPGSRDGHASPPTNYHHQAQDGMSDNIVTSYAKSDTRSQNSGQEQGHMLQTPTLTGSSIGTSPERPTAHAMAGLASPIVRIESYSRGDSPNRPAGQLGRSASKRSRSSSHLAIEHDDCSSEEEVEQEGRHDSGTTIMADVRTGRLLTSGRAGLDPQARLQVGDTEVPNLKDQAENEQLASKIADVQDWLAHSDTGSDACGNLSPPVRPQAAGRRRAKSTGDRTLTHENLMTLRNAPPSAADLHIPGPGLMIDESGDDDWDMDDDDEDIEDDEGLPETPPAMTGIEDPTGNVPEAAADHQFASPPPLYRAHVWQDPLYDSTDPGPGVKMQPITSNEAIKCFQKRAADMETLSRAATWGTRRLSEGDLEGLFHRFSFRNNDDDKPKGERRGSFLEAAAAKLLPKRSQSILKRKESEASKQQPHRPSITDHKKMDSSGSRQESLAVPGPQRKLSIGKRPKSPRIDTGSAVAAMAGQIASIGAGQGGPATAGGSVSPTGPWKNVIKRNRSRSDLQTNRSSGNLADLWTKQGGPPMPTLAAPPASPPQAGEKPAPIGDLADMDEDEEDEAADDKGVTIDLSIRAEPLIPTMEGFRSNVRKLNPRLPPFLVERIAQEQLRRYKKLIDFKVKHAQALATGKCPSNKHCLALGGEPTYLPSKSSSKEAADLSNTGFAIAGLEQSEDDANALAEGVVTPAQFPPGVPMPPVKRLPAEFECSLCFKVKKFHKPSDWSKHVHEDVQPFTCTFQSCAEPKSFKRKADWVRHENERHRQLEWWMCNMHDCSHTCYRKDNFVQHLVREHKLPEPKVKTTKTVKPAVRGPSSQKARANKSELDESADELDQVWRLVDECRHETQKNPKEEACKFCGNVCNSWKKLTVHLAKHMEQISMPVLNVAKAKEVTPETIISPIEQRSSQNNSNSPIGPGPFSQNPSMQHSLHSSISPFGNMNRSTMPPTNDLSGPYTPMQAGFYDNEPMSQFHRNQPSTYPPPLQQQSPPNYPANRGAPYNMASYNTYDSGAASNQFVPINPPSPRTTYQYSQSTSPEALYTGGMRPPPTSQPRTSSFAGQQQRPTYPTSTTYPQQGHFPTSNDHSYRYQRTANNSPPMTSYSQAQATQSMGAQVAMTYGQIEDLTFPQQQQQPPQGVRSMYGQHQARGGYGY